MVSPPNRCSGGRNLELHCKSQSWLVLNVDHLWPSWKTPTVAKPRYPRAQMSKLYCLAVCGSTLLSLSQGLSSREPPLFVEIANPLQQRVDKLPLSFASGWSTWILQHEVDSDTPKWTKIPNSGDFVNPISFHELWHPVDLRYPKLRLVTGMHIRDGVPRHIMPALDTMLENHRNRGLNTVPRAWRWMDFTSYLAGSRNCSLQLQVQGIDHTDDANDSHVVLEMDSVKESVDFAFSALASDPPTELGSGSAIIHIVAQVSDTIIMPKPGNRLELALVEDGDDVIGRLDVDIVPTAAGSQSEYIPNSYQALYNDVECLDPAYVDFQKRKTSRSALHTETGTKGPGPQSKS